MTSLSLKLSAEENFKKCFIILPELWTLLFLTVYYYHVTSVFQSESTLYSCLNVKELLAQSKRKIWSLSDCNWTRTHNHLVRKRTRTKWLWVRVQLQFFIFFFFFFFNFKRSIFLWNGKTKELFPCCWFIICCKICKILST